MSPPIDDNDNTHQDHFLNVGNDLSVREPLDKNTAFIDFDCKLLNF